MEQQKLDISSLGPADLSAYMFRVFGANFSAEHAIVLRETWQLADSAHEEQYRKSGEPFIYHPASVFLILVVECGIRDLRIGVDSLLHDTVEDTEQFTPDALIASELMRREFAEQKILEIYLPRGLEDVPADVLALSRIPGHDVSRFLELTAAQGYAACFVRIADRIHNLRCHHALSTDKQESLFRESLQHYLPFAENLELAFRNLHQYRPKRTRHESCAVQEFSTQANRLEAVEELNFETPGREGMAERVFARNGQYLIERDELHVREQRGFSWLPHAFPEEAPRWASKLAMLLKRELYSTRARLFADSTYNLTLESFGRI